MSRSLTRSRRLQEWGNQREDDCSRRADAEQWAKVMEHDDGPEIDVATSTSRTHRLNSRSKIPQWPETIIPHYDFGAIVVFSPGVRRSVLEEQVDTSNFRRFQCYCRVPWILPIVRHPLYGFRCPPTPVAPSMESASTHWHEVTHPVPKLESLLCPPQTKTALTKTIPLLLLARCRSKSLATKFLLPSTLCLDWTKDSRRNSSSRVTLRLFLYLIIVISLFPSCFLLFALVILYIQLKLRQNFLMTIITLCSLWQNADKTNLQNQGSFYLWGE